MTDIINFFVIGGDKRYDMLTNFLTQSGYTAFRINSSDELFRLEAKKNSVAILPYPISPDGVNIVMQGGGIPLAGVLKTLSKHGIKRISAGAIRESMKDIMRDFEMETDDYGKDEALLQKNALCSAEGALNIIMRELNKTVHGSRFTVIGYGRIGRIISMMLCSLGADVSAVARKKEARSLMFTDGVKAFSMEDIELALNGCDAVINTVPATVLGMEELAMIDNGTLVLDLASAPGGIDRDSAEILGVRVVWALSIPGKYAPLTAAKIIFEHISEHYGLGKAEKT